MPLHSQVGGVVAQRNALCCFQTVIHPWSRPLSLLFKWVSFPLFACEGDFAFQSIVFTRKGFWKERKNATIVNDDGDNCYVMVVTVAELLTMNSLRCWQEVLFLFFLLLLLVLSFRDFCDFVLWMWMERYWGSATRMKTICFQNG